LAMRLSRAEGRTHESFLGRGGVCFCSAGAGPPHGASLVQRVLDVLGRQASEYHEKSLVPHPPRAGPRWQS